MELSNILCNIADSDDKEQIEQLERESSNVLSILESVNRELIVPMFKILKRNPKSTTMILKVEPVYKFYNQVKEYIR